LAGAPPKPLAGFKEHTSKRRDGRDRRNMEWMGRKGKERGDKRGRKRGKCRIPPPTFE